MEGSAMDREAVMQRRRKQTAGGGKRSNREWNILRVLSASDMGVHLHHTQKHFNADPG